MDYSVKEWDGCPTMPARARGGAMGGHLDAMGAGAEGSDAPTARRRARVRRRAKSKGHA
ncbi:hypothetical protein [Streptomyces sp. NPDC050560]|uniref:hypothetical protein n=1 Tax=Streptomyces sp. NPDC050560 TaxID=3365630 RepID=UPI003791D287